MKRSSLKRKLIVSTIVAMNVLVCSSVQAFAAWNDNHSGYATYTSSGYSGGAVLLDPIPSTMEITALNTTDLNYNGINAALAGAYLEVQGPNGKKTTVYVTDEYPEAPKGALDLCPTSFAKIGNMSAGKININWHIVKAPITGMFSYRIKEGSSPYWAAIQVRNHKYPVVKMEFLKGSAWVNMEKMPYNHFLGNNMGTGSIKIRITDIRGISVTDTITALPQNGSSPAYIIPGHVQLPD